MFIASDLPAIADKAAVVFLRTASRPHPRRRHVQRCPGRATKVPQIRPPASPPAGITSTIAGEIAEQPEAVLDTMRGAIEFDPPGVSLPDLKLSDADIASIRRVVLLGMGTSFHSAQIGRTYIEQLAGLPAEADNASEYRYRNPVLDSSTLVIAIGQSGETVDTLAAMHQAKRQGAKVVTVCNTPGSQATRVADGGTVFMRCGAEVAVASTKTFLGSLVAIYLLACHLGRHRCATSDGLRAALDDLAPCLTWSARR
jgi:glucosamine--fructose-6-phosphate aminotransferase (isomerizing)